MSGLRNRESGIGNRDFEFPYEGPAGGFAEEGPGGIVDHRDLDIYKTAMALATEVYRVSKGLPSDERFGLISQMRRAAVSIPANIAEGYGHETRGAYVQFLRIAPGSARELETLLDLAMTLEYLDPADNEAAVQDRCSRGHDAAPSHPGD